MALHAQPAAPVPTQAPAVLWRVLGGALVLLCGAVSIASFVKGDPSRNDFERFADLRLLFLYFGLFGGLCAVYVAAYRQRQVVPQRTLLATCVACVILLLAGFPVGSRDVFFYAFYGKIWGFYHANPYMATIADFPSDSWQPLVQAQWRDKPALYGPLALWQSWLIHATSGAHLWAAVWLYKAAATATLALTLWVAKAILQPAAAATDGRAANGLMLLVWNPLFLFECAGNAHNEITMVLLVVTALWCWREEYCNTSLTVLALSFWYKWYSLIFLPAFLIAALQRSGVRATIRDALVYTGAAVLFGLVLLAPLPGSLLPVSNALLHSGATRGIYPAELSPPLAALFWSLRASGLLATDQGLRLFHGARLALLCGALVLVFTRQWRATDPFAALSESCCLVAAAFFLLFVTILPPWHLLLVITLAIVCGREPFLLAAVVLTVLAMLSYFLTFAVATLMLCLIVGVLWSMRRLGGRGIAHERYGKIPGAG
jgi:hypothetical protein